MNSDPSESDNGPTRAPAFSGGSPATGVPPLAAWCGSICLLFAVGVLVLTFISGPGADAALPFVWKRYRPIWYLLGCLALVCGWNLLKEPRPQCEQWTPETAGIRFRRLVLYIREGCHLCDQAKDSLIKYSMYLPKIEEVNVDEDHELRSKFDNCVPVVECDGRICFRGQVNEVLLRRLIEGTPPLE